MSSPRTEKIHIALDNPHRSYFAGQAVSGCVVIHNERPNPVKEVSILLVGQGKIKWKDHHYLGDKTLPNLVKDQPAPNPLTNTTTFSATENYARDRIPLFGDGETLITLPEGNLSYPFRFILPPNLPSSFKSPYGQVTYVLEAELKKPFSKANDRACLPFTVNGIFDLNMESGAGLPQEFRRSKGSNYYVCRRGQLGFSLTVPRSGFVPGEFLDFRAEITNNSNKKVNEMQVSLEQVIQCFGKGKTKMEERIISILKGPEVEQGEYEVWSPGNWKVPSVPPTKLGGGCGIIDVQYNLLFDMKIEGLSSWLSGKIPVMVGTIPMRDTFREFARETEASTSTSAPTQEQLFLPDYPDLPPPSYAEAVAARDFPSWGDGGDGEGQDDSGATASLLEDFVPNYIKYSSRM